MIKNIFIPERIGGYFIFKQNCIGLEISGSSIQVARAQVNGKTITILNTSEGTFEINPTAGSEENDKILGEAIQALLNKMGRYNKVRIAIPSNQVVFKELSFEFDDLQKIGLVLPFELESLIPFPIEQAVIDFVVTHHDAKAKKMRVLVSITQKAIIERLLHILTTAGIEPSAAVVDMCALYSFVQEIPEYQKLTGGVCLINMGTHATEIAYLQNGSLRMVRTLDEGVLSSNSPSDIDLMLKSGPRKPSKDAAATEDSDKKDATDEKPSEPNETSEAKATEKPDDEKPSESNETSEAEATEKTVEEPKAPESSESSTATSCPIPEQKASELPEPKTTDEGSTAKQSVTEEIEASQKSSCPLPERSLTSGDATADQSTALQVCDTHGENSCPLPERAITDGSAATENTAVSADGKSCPIPQQAPKMSDNQSTALQVCDTHGENSCPLPERAITDGSTPTEAIEASENTAVSADGKSCPIPQQASKAIEASENTAVSADGKSCPIPQETPKISGDEPATEQSATEAIEASENTTVSADGKSCPIPQQASKASDDEPATEQPATEQSVTEENSEQSETEEPDTEQHVPIAPHAEQGGVDHLFSQIQFTMEAFKSQLPDFDPITSVLVTGSGANNPQLANFIRDRFNIPAQLIDSKQLNHGGMIRLGKDLRAIPPQHMMSVAVASPTSKIREFNFLNSFFGMTNRRQLFTQATVCFVLLGTFMAVVLGYFFFTVHGLSRQVSRAERETMSTLRTTFSVQGKTLYSLKQDAEEQVAQEEQLWFSFSKQTRFSFLRYIESLSEAIDRQSLDLRLKRLHMTEDLISLQGDVKSLDAVDVLEEELNEYQNAQKVAMFSNWKLPGESLLTDEKTKRARFTMDIPIAKDNGGTQ